MEKNFNFQEKKAKILSYFKMLQKKSNSKSKLESQSNDDKVFQIKLYDPFLADCFAWTYRFKYLKLFLSFTNHSISSDKFVDQFLELRSSMIEEFYVLMGELETNFEPSLLDRFVIDELAFGFSDIIDETHEDCDVVVSDQLLESMGETSREPGDIDEDEFYSRIKKATFTIQKQIDKDIK